MKYPDLIARAIRIINSNGVMKKSGHVAARDADRPDVMWINSRKASRSSLTARDIVRVSLKTGEPLGNDDEPPSEFHIHRAIFNRRPDVGAIVHAHPQYVVALSIAGQQLVPVTIDGGFLGGPVPVFDDAGHISSPERGELIADAIGNHPALVMRGHGMVVVGRNVEEAITRIGLAEDNAHTQYLGLAIGAIQPLRADEVAVIAGHTSSEKSVRKAFHYEEETARREGALEGLA
jgi:ribulose-5-phosphate 4-epimerase/fuculose-1-phosphate aldolase